jgi:hypothetical protein
LSSAGCAIALHLESMCVQQEQSSGEPEYSAL